VDKTIRKSASLDDMKADEYLYWQSRPAWERLAAVTQLTQELYAMKGEVGYAPKLERTLVCVERLWR
jgi:hypothetical protein